MWGRQVNESRRTGFLLALGGSGVVFVMALAILLANRSVSTVNSPNSALPANPPAASVNAPEPVTQPSVTPVPSPSIQVAQAAPSEQISASTSATTGTTVSANGVRQGVLRISNPTEYPIRVALLARKSTSSSSAKPAYEVPAHWDFAPQEGGTKGLIVSLPNRNLKVKKGDVLVAFAQDGSRRYWGPFVVGETELPVWNPKGAEWELVLQP